MYLFFYFWNTVQSFYFIISSLANTMASGNFVSIFH